MANYNEWLKFSDIGNIKDLPKWMKDSMSGAYFAGRLKNTFAGELTPEEIKQMTQLSKVHDKNIATMSKQIEQKFKDLGFEVKFNLSKDGVLSLGFRPKGVATNKSWGETSSIYRVGLDRGTGTMAGNKGGLRSNKLMIDAEGALFTAQEAQLEQILKIISDKKTINLLNEYKNPEKWLQSSKYKTELQNKLYPARKIGEMAIMGVSKSKMNSIMADHASMDKADIQQYARQIMQAREISLAAFYKQQAADFRKVIPDLKKLGGTYESSIDQVSGMLKEIVTSVLTFQGDNATALQMMEVAKESAILKQNAAQWKAFTDKVMALRKMKFTWSGEAANVYGGAGLAIGRHNAIAPGMELSELGNKVERAAGNMLVSSSKRNSSFTRPLRVISKAMDEYTKAIGKGVLGIDRNGKPITLNNRPQQAMRVAYVNEGVQFNPDLVAKEMANILEAASKGKNVDIAKKYLGKDYERFMKQYSAAGSSDAWIRQNRAMFQKSLDLEQILVSSGAVSSFNSRRENPIQMIEKSLLDSRAAAIQAGWGSDARNAKKTKEISQQYARILAARELTGYHNIRLTAGEGTDEGQYLIQSFQQRRGQTGTKAMFGTGVHGTIDVAQDPVMAIFLRTLGFGDADIFDSHGRYRVGAIATNKASARTLGGNTHRLINRMSAMMMDEATHDNGNYITDKNMVAARAKQLVSDFAKQVGTEAFNLTSGKVSKQFATSLFKDFFTLNDRSNGFVADNIQTVIDKAIQEGKLSAGLKSSVISAFETGMVKTMQGMYGRNGTRMTSMFGNLPVGLDAKGNIITVNPNGMIADEIFGQPDIALYGNPYSKGGRPASFGYKNVSNLLRGSHLASVHDKNANTAILQSVYDTLFREGLLHSTDKLISAQTGVDRLVGDSRLTKDYVRQHKGNYAVFTDQDIYGNDDSYYDNLKNLQQVVVDGDMAQGRRGYAKDAFEKSIFYKIMQAQRSGKRALWNYGWAGSETNQFGSTYAIHGDYVGLGNLDFELVKGADGQEYYVPKDTAEGMMSLTNVQEMSGLIHGRNQALRDMRIATSDEDRQYAELRLNSLPAEYLKTLQDMVYEKNSSLVSGATKAQLRHSIGGTLIAAPIEDSYYGDILSGGARGLMSRRAMKGILSRIDKEEDEAGHSKAIQRIAQDLGINVAAGESTADTIENILNKIDVDSKDFDAKTAKGILGLGMRYPLLTDLNMPGLEFFVSSQHSMNKDKNMDTQTIMLNRSIMDMLNADVDGDKAYMILSLADASVGNLSDEEYKDLVNAHQALKDYGDRITKKIATYNKNKGITPVNNTIIGQNDIASHNFDINSQIISNLAGEATKKNFADVGKYDNLRQMVQNFEQQRGGGIWKLNKNGLGTGAGQISADDLFTSLIATEFATIFPQEGISAKKVYEKLAGNTAFDWGSAKTEEEKQALLQNAFRGTYEKLKDNTTFTEEGLADLGAQLAGWGLIKNEAGATAASDKRAATLLAIMAEATGDDSWLNKTLDWQTISKEILKYQSMVSDKDILLQNGEKLHINGLGDLFKFNKNKLLPYSRLASYQTLGGSGSEWSSLSEAEQRRFLSHFSVPGNVNRFNLGTNNYYYGAGSGMAQGFDSAKYQALYRNMAGMYGGTQDDLVAAALAEYEATGKLPHMAIASGLGKFLYKTNTGDITADKENADTIAYLNRIAELTPKGIQNLSLDEKATLSSLYKDTGINNLFRGNFMNIAQIMSRYGRNTAGGINSFADIQKAYETGNYSKLGLSPKDEEALKKEWGKKALTLDEFRAMASLNLGGKDYSSASLQDIIKDARSFISSSTASQDQVFKAHDVINMSHLMSAGGGPAQLFDLLNNFAAITEDPKAVEQFIKMTDIAAEVLKDYDVVGTEQNLAGFINNGAAAGGQKMAGVRGSADLVLKKHGGGVRIADYKSVNFVPTSASDQYIAQLMAYGYAYNQMRDNIRRTPGLTYEQFQKSGQNKLYERLMGKTLDENMFNLMASDEGALEDLALHYVTKTGQVRTFSADYDKLMNSASGQAVMGALLNKALNEDGSINYDILTNSEAWTAIKKIGFKSSLKENEYIEPYKGLSQEEQTRQYEKNAKEIAKLEKAREKHALSMLTNGIEINLDSKDANNTYLNLLNEEIEQLHKKQEALTEVDEQVKKNYTDEAALETKRLEAEKEATEAQERRKANLSSFEQALQAYTKYQQESWKLEAKRGKVSGRQREVVDFEKEIVDGYLGEAKQALETSYGALSDKDKEGVSGQIEKSEKQLALFKAHMGLETDQKGIFGKLADGIKMSMSRMFSFGMIGYRIVGKISQAFQKVISYAQQLDQAMVNIQIVTGKTRDEAFDLMSTYNKLAKELGSTTTEVANSANVWFNESRDHIKPL